jgi:hypothetical protein
MSQAAEGTVVMTLLIIEPNWAATPELQDLLGRLRSYDSHTVQAELGGRIVDLVQARSRDSVVHTVEGLPPALPSHWNNILVAKLTVLNPNSPVTKAFDGAFQEDISSLFKEPEGTLFVGARVETYVRNGVMQQHIRVDLTITADEQLRVINPLYEALALWYDRLRAGEKNHLVRVAVEIPPQPPVAGAHSQ